MNTFLKLFLVGTASHFIIKKLKKQTYIKNNSNYFVFFKPENTTGRYTNNKAYPISPLKTFTGKFDGIATVLYNDMVYKLTNGISAIVNNDGSVDIDLSTATITEKLYFEINGGWKEINYFHKKNDNSWDELFKAAEII